MTWEPKQLTILIIEDNTGDLVLIEDYLNEEFENPIVSSAKSFSQAETILSSGVSLDAILLDLSLPDLDGKELVNNIAALAKNIPVIVLTGFANKEFGISTLSLGISDYLLKDELNSSQLKKSILYSLERKRIARKLNESEEKYRHIFQYSPMPMWTFELDSLKFLDVNDATIKHYGFTRSEFLNMTLKDIRPVEDISFLEQEVEFFRKSKGSYENIIKHRKKNGAVIAVNLFSTFVLYDGKDAALVLVNDVTDKFNAQIALQNSEQRFKALVQDGSDLIAILDLTGNYIYVSPTTNNILGISPNFFIGKNAFDFIHEADKERVSNYFSMIGTIKRISLEPYRFQVGENDWRWIETTATDMTDDPAVGGIVANSKDITERINYINAIKQQNVKLTEISWMQSHVVRAPLARIMGLVDIISNHSIEEAEKKELLNHLQASAFELDKVIRNIVEKTEEVKEI